MTNVEHAVVLRLIAFADQAHQFSVDTCFPQPGRDCWGFCTPCRILAAVPAEVVAEARAVTGLDTTDPGIGAGR